jgi:tRNA nucleotidyltransferase/poly(A) polymerase
MQWREELTRRFPALTKLGGDCYIVGGAIRDLLLGREPADADIACNDPLAAAKTIRPRVIRLGDAEHLSAYRVVDREHVYDFAELLDHDIDVDLARRDFTVNAMAVHLGSGELLDPHGGQRDLASRTVRMVDASNFDDDPLRLLKAVRMAVKYDFAIEEETLAAIRARAPRIVEMAAERVTYELSVIFGSGRFWEGVGLLKRTQLAEPLGLRIRESRPSPGAHASPSPRLEGRAEGEGRLSAAYALLVENPHAYAKRWKWSAGLLHDVLALQRLVEHHDRIALFDAGESLAHQLPAVLRALGREGALDLPDFSIRPLLTGDEIAQLTGLKPGKELGRVKRSLLEAQIRGDVKTKEDAAAYVTA